MYFVLRIMIFPACAFLAACSSTPKVESRVTALRNPGSLTRDEVKRDLLRVGEDYGHYAVDIYPETEALREVEVREENAHPDADGEATKLRITAARESNSRLCFRIKLHTMSYHINDLSRWEFLVLGGEHGEQKLELQNPQNYRPFTKASYRYNYATSGLACAYGNMDNATAYRIYIVPPRDWESLAGPVHVRWHFQ